MTVLDQRALKRHRGSVDEFRLSLVGATVVSAERRGKFMWFPLDIGQALVVHLGMSGQFRINDGNPPRHERIRLDLDGLPSVSFHDQRLFGSLAIDEFVETERGVVPSQVAHIARDVLDPDLDVDALIRRMRGRSVAVKNLLLNQEVVAGIGNIYADEALWSAGIHYATPADRISARDYRNLLVAIHDVMSAALDAGGTSFDDLYVNVNGESGYFELSLNAYGQTGKPCARCGTSIVRDPWQNRSSHFCPRCQRRRR